MRMPAIVAALALTVTTATGIRAQVPAEQLAKPPADATHLIVSSTGGKHGDSWIWRAPDGMLMARESVNLRGMVSEVEAASRTGPDGMPQAVVIRGFTVQGDAGETFGVEAGTATWKSQIDAGSMPYAVPAYYFPVGGPIGTYAWLLETLLRRPDRAMTLLPGGMVTAERLMSLEIGQAAARRTVTAWALSGLGTSPIPVWANTDGSFFGLSLGLSWLPEGYESDRAQLRKAQDEALAARMPRLARSLATTPAGAVAFTDVQLFDADRMRFAASQTVVVVKGRIRAVGPAATTRVPPGAMVIAGGGKTLVPGMWDSHMHVGDDYTGLQELSMGVTSVRDPGNDDIRTLDRRRRIRSGDLLSPNVYPSSLIDGKGPYTAQVANVATSEAEAIALVRRAKRNGFSGVKFYGSFNPEWLLPAIAVAKQLGLHAHGHVPAGIRPMDAIEAGYDEITHINWVIMQAMPDSIIAVSNGIMRFEGPGRYARDVDLDAEPMKSLVATMAAKGIYSDPTMVVFEAIYYPENGQLSPAYAPFVGTLPPTTERGFRQGGFRVPPDLTREDYRRSWAKMVELLRRMHRAGVPIVAGTDGSGIELIRELEIYQQAGMTPGEALATATIVPARLIGVDRQTGSIAPGKIADLVLVEGDPSLRLGDLRQTRVIMLGGKLMDADSLRAAAGFGGRPR